MVENNFINKKVEDWVLTLPFEDRKFIPNLSDVCDFIVSRREEVKKIPFKYASQNIRYQDRSSATSDGHLEVTKQFGVKLKQFLLTSLEQNKKDNNVRRK